MSLTKKAKIIITNIPLRPPPPKWLPYGSLSVISALRKAEFSDTHFYNIDFLRPEFDEIVAHLKKEKPDILGISAVVSTSYAYTKKLSLAVKEILPDTTIILGGNMGASAEILLKKTGVDFICTGEGEKTIVDFVNCWLTAKGKSDYSGVEGLAFLNENRDMILTPYPKPLAKEEVYDIDWSIMEELGQLTSYIRSPDAELVEDHFPMAAKKEGKDGKKPSKTWAHLLASKGCVAKCTFCHRWDTGIRYIPVPVVMKRLDYFIEKFNAGFITFVDENFGTDKRWLKIFLEEIKKRDVLWHVGGMRVNCISPEWIVRMKESGCTTIDFGMESGSQRILDIMEKVTTVEQNKNTVKWLVENNLKSVIRLVLGMPGETPETVQESSDFCGFAVEQSPEVDPNAIAINFARALPGTPLYETARRRGLIGPTLEDEEKYMLDISNKNATHIDTYLNYLDYPKLFIEKWYFEICNHTRNAYIDKWGLDNYWNILLRSNRFKNLKEAKPVLEGEDWDYFASQDFRKNGKGSAQIKLPTLFSLARQNTFSSVSSFYPRFFWRMRPFTMVFVIINAFRKHGTPQTIKLLREYLIWHFSRIFRFKTSQKSIEYLSLRKLLKKNFYPEVSGDNPAMVALRKGR